MINKLNIKKIVLFLAAVIFAAVLFSQQGKVKGTLYDTLAKTPVNGATITVLKKKDSSLVTFTMTNSSGVFSLTNLANDDYRILFTHVNYHNTTQFFSISDSAGSANLGSIIMNDKTVMLDEVVITSEAPPVTLIDDTVQYNAGSFKTKPNAVVEDLLKKLPGVQVDKDGKVKAQGEEVKKILVDGKEFFGNDPKVATKNLPADAVDKVQVYDKQSDMSQLTGFDDGNYEKTINLKLKQDKKQGVFGKVSAGVGTDNRYEGKFNINAFKGARQFSVLGMANNTNAEGFSFMDAMSFMGGMGAISGEGGNININIRSDDPIAGLLGGNSGSSINTSWAGGVNYNNIIGKKMELNGNYFYNRFNPVTQSKTARQYILPDSTYFYNSNALTDNRSNNHRFNVTLDYLIDSMTSLKFTPNISYQEGNSSSFTDYEQLSDKMIKSIVGFSNNSAASKGINFTNGILFRKKFNKRGRTFSINLNTVINDGTADGFLNSVNQFYSGGSLFRTDSVNQKSNTQSLEKSYNARAVYTEPLSKRSLLELSISNANSNSTSNKETYDYNGLSKMYDLINDIQTNDFENIYRTNSAGVRMRNQQRKYSYAVGVNWQNANLEGKIVSGNKDSVISKSFYNLLPAAQFKYSFSRFKNISLFYSTSTKQPSVSQLQPVPDNSNTLNIQLGNPDLKQEFAHRLRLNYTGINPFGGKSFFVFTNFTATNNRIVNYEELDDTLGIRRTTPVNVNGTYSVNNDISIGWPLKFIKATLNFNTAIDYSKNIQFISINKNTAKSIIYNTGISPELQINKTVKEKLDINFSAGVSFSRASYILQPALNNNYVTKHIGTDIGWELPKNFYLTTDFTYNVNTQRSAGFNAKVPLWNAAFSKSFLKFQRGEIKLRVYDILNKNQGIRRNTNNNYIEDVSNKILKRFFMLSFTYNLNKMNAGGGRKGDIRIIRGG